MKSHIIIHTDGGSRGNPGLAAIGFTFHNESEKLLYSSSMVIGTATNNEAEYRAILEALKIAAIHFTDATITLYADTELVVSQLTGKYKVRSADLLPFYNEIKQLEKKLTSISYIHVRRELNKLADKIVNAAMDGSPVLENNIK